MEENRFVMPLYFDLTYFSYKMICLNSFLISFPGIDNIIFVMIILSCHTHKLK